MLKRFRGGWKGRSLWLLNGTKGKVNGWMQVSREVLQCPVSGFCFGEDGLLLEIGEDTAEVEDVIGRGLEDLCGGVFDVIVD